MGEGDELHAFIFVVMICYFSAALLKSFVVLPPERNIMPRKSASFTLFFKPVCHMIHAIDIQCIREYAGTLYIALTTLLIGHPKIPPNQSLYLS